MRDCRFAILRRWPADVLRFFSGTRCQLQRQPMQSAASSRHPTHGLALVDSVRGHLRAEVNADLMQQEGEGLALEEAAREPENSWQARLRNAA